MEMQILEARRPQHGDVTLIPTPPLQRTAIAINFFFPTLSLFIVVLRCYSRIKFRQFGIDDFLICWAMLFALLLCPFFYMYMKLTYVGWHMEDVPKDFDRSAGSWWFFIAQLFYNPILAFVKASVLVFLLRLGGHQQNLRYAIHALNTFNGLQAIAVFLVALFQCIPIAANWDPLVKANAKCVDNSFHIIISSITILTDIAVVALPFWIFLGLKMPTPAKVAVIGVFVLGLSVVIISIIRLVKLVQLFYIPRGTDPFYDIGTTLNVIEVNIAIISASGPALRGIFRRYMPSWFGGSSGAKYGISSAKVKYGSHTQQDDSTNGLSHTNRSIALKNMHRASRSQHTEIRSSSPNESEEEIMTYNGIMRTMDVRVHFSEEAAETASMSRASSDLKGEKYAGPRAL